MEIDEDIRLLEENPIDEERITDEEIDRYVGKLRNILESDIEAHYFHRECLSESRHFELWDIMVGLIRIKEKRLAQ